jgi:hypothetical protein
MRLRKLRRLYEPTRLLVRCIELGNFILLYRGFVDFLIRGQRMEWIRLGRDRNAPNERLRRPQDRRLTKLEEVLRRMARQEVRRLKRSPISLNPESNGWVLVLDNSE